MAYQVGQKLYFVPDSLSRGNPKWVGIEKVGKKWLWLEHKVKVDKETLIVDGGEYASPGRCWIDEATYQHYVSLKKTWREFRVSVDRYWNVPDGVTIEQIKQASVLLFGERE
jgi:hypothetical protein